MGERRKARELALQVLFQIDVGKTEVDDAIYDFLDKQTDDKETKGFALELIKGTLENLKDIDKLIKDRLQNWDFDRIANVDKNILRFALFELIYRKDIPVAVTINEAIEIAKDFSGKEAGKFVNGILDKIKEDKNIIKE